MTYEPGTDHQRDLKRARQTALRLLASRDRSRHEMTARLTTRAGAEAARQVVEELTESGYLDDRQFAHRLVHTLSERRHHGPTRLRMELKRYGIDPELCASAIAEVSAPEQLQATALAAARTCLRRPLDGPMDASDTKAQRRLAGYLGRRGFSPSIIHDMLSLVRQGRLWDDS